MVTVRLMNEKPSVFQDTEKSNTRLLIPPKEKRKTKRKGKKRKGKYPSSNSAWTNIQFRKKKVLIKKVQSDDDKQTQHLQVAVHGTASISHSLKACE